MKAEFWAFGVAVLVTACSVDDPSPHAASTGDLPTATQAPLEPEQAVEMEHQGSPLPTSQAAGSSTAEPSSTGTSSNNIVASGGRVTTTLGPMVNIESSRPIKHIFQGPSGQVPAKIYLSHEVRDGSGNVLSFSIDYVDERQSMVLNDRGFLTTGKNSDPTTEDLATAGTVTISPEQEGRLRIVFQGIEMAHRAADGVTLTPRPPLGDGTVVGDVERVCVVTVNGQPQADSTWSDPFCAMYAK